MKRVFVAIALMFVLLLTTSMPVYANGNEWVYDESQVISQETEDYIKNLNENVFAGYKNKPQLAFIIIDDLPYNINDYKLDLFNEYGVGTADENCGMLFVLAINDRRYGLEIGDGFKEGSLLREDLETDFITSNMKSSLQAQDYDSVVLQIAQHLEKLMADEENGVYAQKEAEIIVQNQASANEVINYINSIGEVEYTSECENLIRCARQAYNALTKKQSELVTNYEILKNAEDTYQKLNSEAIINHLLVLFKEFCKIFILVDLALLGLHIVKSYVQKKKINELCDKHYKHIRIAGINDLDSFKKTFHKHLSDCNLEFSAIETEFFRFTHECYIAAQIDIIQNLDSLQETQKKYETRLKQINDLDAFVSCTVTPVNEIIDMIDFEEKKKKEIIRQNTDVVNCFFQENEHRITCLVITEEIKNELCKRINDTYVVGYDELEDVFTKSLKELSFKWEYEKFCAEHHNEITSNLKDFNSSEFYRSIKETENYKNYRSDSFFNNNWMLPLLMLHMSQQRKNRIEREKREEQERIRREQRRRDEALQRELNRMRSHNSSFCSSFGGGSSSGGGFSGGW